MKKLFPLVLVLVLGLAACEGGEDEEEGEDEGNVPATQSYAAAPTPFNFL